MDWLKMVSSWALDVTCRISRCHERRWSFEWTSGTC